jgi:superfamily II DNA or RNA helicase
MNLTALQDSRTLRPYQEQAINAIINNLNTSVTHIIAFCTGGGKTLTAQTLIKRLSNKRCLVLTHNQTILRDNFSTEFANGTSIVTYEGPQDLVKAMNAKVVIGIPAGVVKVIEHLGQFDYLVVDEAHQYINNDCTMFKKIKSHLGVIPEVLLTASHYPFQGDNYIKHLYSREQALADGVINDIEIQLIRTDWHPRSNQFDQNQNLKSKFTIPKVYGIEVCREIASKIQKGDYLKKSLIACHNVKTAERVYEFFNAKYPGKVSLSTSHNDTEAKAFEDFQNNNNTRILVVVNRGIIGFDCPSLERLFDLTLSKNVARIEQLLGRLIRQAAVDKIYYRIAPSVDLLNHSIVMNSVLALSVNSNNQQYDGTPVSLKIIFRPEDKESILAEQAAAKARIQARMLTELDEEEGTELDYAAGGSGQLAIDNVSQLKSPLIMKATEYIDKFNKVMNAGSDVWALEGFTRLSDALGLKKPDGYWTLQNVLEEVKKYNSMQAFAKENRSAFSIACDKDWINQIWEATGWKKANIWTLEKILQEAKKYDSMSDFFKGSCGAYVSARNKGWIDQVWEATGWDQSRRSKPTKHWTLDNVLAEVKKHNSLKDLRKHEQSAYTSAWRNDWLDEIYKVTGWKRERKRKH